MTPHNSKEGSFLPVVIVESHQHVLEHIHFMLRRRMMMGKKTATVPSWSLIHYDSHPDLAACPDIPARLYFTPSCQEENSLYDRLDQSRAGISEWILPLVLAAELKTIHWIKREPCQQFALGKHCFHVGVATAAHEEQQQQQDSPGNIIPSFLDLSDDARLKVDWHHPYYLDDDMVEPTLVLPKPLELQVRHVEEGPPRDGSSRIRDVPWILDICLDYFICRNPFLNDIERLSPAYSREIVELQNQGLEILATSDLSISEYRIQRQKFQTSLDIFLKEGRTDLLVDFLGTSASTTARVELLKGIFHKIPNLVPMTLEAINHLTMPHEEIPSRDEIILRIQAVMADIEQYTKATNSAPFMITIARSTDDGFCPNCLVEWIQESLLQQLTTMWGDHNSLQILRDYGKWEGSTLNDLPRVA